MRVTKTKVAEHRRSILSSASRLFRERGFRDVGVAEIMQASGLTHGAFYGHFRSKADLADEACRDACAEGLERWLKSADLTEILDRYLTTAHRDDPAGGCALSALGPEVARQSADLQKGYAQGLKSFIAALERHMKGETPEERHRQAVATMASMIGALTMARGVAAGDPEMSADILDIVCRQLSRSSGV
ncbi:TetR/AcrR family transcriptional regulator [Starkeya koreensis]|uniref:TetR/AcrR family transcriptional regulator n=1 Tax=Ancylobacter koreensis TaxID=266121 RepID=A0ABT0DL31_9HYPH|nr:TetR family transcriptional regulator [Ancylobacter koreensis]MCK0207998.1 TetR/AcrR family transcriptional regulator [Ancylobacter koreensis]